MGGGLNATKWHKTNQQQLNFKLGQLVAFLVLFVVNKMGISTECYLLSDGGIAHMPNKISAKYK